MVRPLAGGRVSQPPHADEQGGTQAGDQPSGVTTLPPRPPDHAHQGEKADQPPHPDAAEAGLEKVRAPAGRGDESLELLGRVQQRKGKPADPGGKGGAGKPRRRPSRCHVLGAVRLRLAVDCKQRRPEQGDERPQVQPADHYEWPKKLHWPRFRLTVAPEN